MQLFAETTVILHGIPAQVLTFEALFPWLLVALGAFALAALLVALLSLSPERLTLHFVRCPQGGRLAHVAVRRGRDGRAIGVQRCSLLMPPTRVTCDRGCLTEGRFG